MVFSRRLEDLERRLGLTSAHRGIYCSNDTFILLATATT
ncbi:MAG: hypothetical protein Rpha_1622 [Candidatus Ruthia sp. Apha_13_S6]|nr:hypothetical protein [Candidatus Ruthia sp. Apha_13_S6]